MIFCLTDIYVKMTSKW